MSAPLPPSSFASVGAIAILRGFLILLPRSPSSASFSPTCERLSRPAVAPLAAPHTSPSSSAASAAPCSRRHGQSRRVLGRLDPFLLLRVQHNPPRRSAALPVSCIPLVQY